MTVTEYGPFANVVGLATALVALFSLLLVKALGRLNKWTWLIDDSPSFLVKGGAQMVAVTLMALSYITINTSNYRWFGIVALVFGIMGLMAVGRFDYLRRVNILKIPRVATDGQHLRDTRGRLQFHSVVIGSETELRASAKTDFEAALKLHPGLSLKQFMSGYGTRKVNDPEALWSPELLAKKSNRLTMLLMGIVLCAVMALFLAAFVIEVASR